MNSQGQDKDSRPRLPTLLGLLLLGASGVACGLTSLRFETGEVWRGIGGATAATRAFLHVPIAFAFLLSALEAFVRSPLRFRLAMVFKAILLAVYLTAVPALSFDLELPLLSVFVLEIALYEAFYLNLLWVTLVTVMCEALRAVSLAGTPAPLSGARILQTAVLPSVENGVYLWLLGAAASLGVHFRELLIEGERKVAQLNNAVTELARANLGYQHYASQAEEKSQVEERHRITRELHDVLGYTFTNNIMMLEAAASRIQKDPAKVRELIELARENARTGMAKIRSSLYLLRAQEPPVTRSANKFHKLVETFRIATGLRVQVSYGNIPDILPPKMESFFYFFLQEALVNSFRHGAATEVRVSFWRHDGCISASVSDNGHGAAEIREGIGLKGMRERLADLGGELTLETLGAGFGIRAIVPFEEEAYEP